MKKVVLGLVAVVLLILIVPNLGTDEATLASPGDGWTEIPKSELSATPGAENTEILAAYASEGELRSIMFARESGLAGWLPEGTYAALAREQLLSELDGEAEDCDPEYANDHEWQCSVVRNKGPGPQLAMMLFTTDGGGVKYALAVAQVELPSESGGSENRVSIDGLEDYLDLVEWE